jgi:hypothetical protein
MHVRRVGMVMGENEDAVSAQFVPSNARVGQERGHEAPESYRQDLDDGKDINRCSTPKIRGGAGVPF